MCFVCRLCCLADFYHNMYFVYNPFARKNKHIHSKKAVNICKAEGGTFPPKTCGMHMFHRFVYV